ncbi:MAG: arginine--tRNA ligase [Planctomycetales bacterium]|nr:arginine--tRNA ligase [Planctomycetales bacterium]
MKRLADILEQRISAALQKVTGQAFAAMVRVAAEPKFGDYQANGVMAAAKQAKTNPRQLAEQVVAALDIQDICEKPEIAGPGFINLRLKDSFLAARLLEMNTDKDRLGVEKTDTPQTVVVDYSGPNIAKQMHVGHLRSTIIGDCIARMYDFEGHTVIRQNHIGDWGTQFGMLCALFDERFLQISDVTPTRKILGELEAFYIEAKKRFDSDEQFANTARFAVAGLHSGEGPWRTYWESIVRESERHYCEIYEKLSVTLKDKDIRGESFYADKLADVVQTLKQNGLAVESEGAICIFPEGFKNKEGEPLPVIIQKSDGAFLYATTDLAALQFRVQELHADTIIYVTDARQAQHFAMLFAVAKMAGWTDDTIELMHITFGTMLGEDGTPFKTRTGGTVKLKDLLDEAVQRAAAVVEAKNPDLPAEQKASIARAVGIGAVKYADYSNNRNSDYIFSFDKMLAMEGNTAPYMQYAYARIKSIERKAAGKDVDIEGELAGITTLTFTDEAEKDLAKLLIRYDQAIDAAVRECRPNYLTGYLYDLSQAFSRFYSACPVLQADARQRPLRLLLCDLTARTIRHGLSELLGIEVVEQM